MIGETIHQLRTERGLSLSELAERSGVAKSYLSSLENHTNSNPSVHVIERIAIGLGVDVQRLIKPVDSVDEVDQEWVELAREAIASGVTKEEFRMFREFLAWHNQQQKG